MRPRLAAERGAELQRQARRRCPASPACVVAGLLLAVELADGRDAKAVYTRAARSVASSPTRSRPPSLRLAPPLTVTERRDRRSGRHRRRRAAGAPPMTRHLLDITDLTADELVEVLASRRATDLPTSARRARACALIFEKPSNRTRQSMEMAVVQLGGHPVYTRGEEVGFDVRESVEDVTRVMAGYHGVLAARVFEHDGGRAHGGRQRRCRWSTCSATTPTRCRRLADVLTMQQVHGPLAGQRGGVRGRLQQRGPLARRGVRAARRHVALGCPVGFHASDAELERLNALGDGHGRAGASRCRRGGRGRSRCTPTPGRRWARRPRRTIGCRRSRATR